MNRAVLTFGMLALGGLVVDCGVDEYMFIPPCGNGTDPAICIDSPGMGTQVEIIGLPGQTVPNGFTVHVSTGAFTLYPPLSPESMCRALSMNCGHVHVHIIDSNGTECHPPYLVLGPSPGTAPSSSVSIPVDLSMCDQSAVRGHPITITVELRHNDHASFIGGATSDTVTNVMIPPP